MNGYEFQGWFFDNNEWTKQLTANYYENNYLNNDVNVYAYYKEVIESFNINFIIDNDIFKTISTSGNETLILPNAPIKNGFTFQGWFFDKDIWEQELTENYYLNSSLNNNINVYAYYLEDTIVPTEFLVTFETNGGSVIEPITTSIIESSPITRKEDYTFKGWFLDKNLTVEITFPYSVEQEITLYAKWEAKPVETISFNMDSNNVITGLATAPEGELVLNIPSEINNQPVKGIGYQAFRDNTQITEITIPDSVTSISLNAFWGCTNLKSIKLPSSLKSISTGTFEYCYSLNSIIIPDGVEAIGADAFMYSGLKEISLPASVKTIGQFAFKDNENLEVVILNKVENLGRGAFEGCISLKQIIIPETVKNIDHHVFTDCTQLSDIQILADDCVIKYSFIDRTAYYNDESNWDNGILYVGKYLVVATTTDSTVSVKDGTTVIADFAFTSSHPLNSISKIVLPETILIIGESAFEGLSNLNNINIPNSVIMVRQDSLLNTGIYNGTNSYWSNNGLYINHFLLAVKNVSMDSFTIKEGTTHICEGALFGSNSSSVSQINLANSLIYIGSENFTNTKITSISLPANLEYIAEKAFYQCFSLTTVDTSQCNNLEYIGYSAFASCNISEFYIPESVLSLDDYIFNHNKNITINCAVAEKPDGWNIDWSKNNTGTSIINWNVKL